MIRFRESELWTITMEAPRPPKPRYEYRVATVDRVVDGDTVDLTVDLGFEIFHRCRVRLAGVNCPETRTRDLEEKKRGLAAKRFATNFLKHRGRITLVSKEYRGKFGRVLGEIEADGESLNASLVETGHAVEYHGGKR